MISVFEAVGASSYPGRGIVLGASEDGKKAIMAYFIMGRSENSRNRVFVPEGEGLRTRAFDPARLRDPSLVIYAPVRVTGETTIVTNGDQTDTIYDFLQKGSSFEAALRTRAFEPDAPNYTPRISGVVRRAEGTFSYALSILKSAQGDPACCQRFFFEYEKPMAGQGHFIHTYAGDGSPLPSFAGDPETVALPGDIDALSKGIWQALDADNKVSLFVRTLDAATGESETRIINKHQED